MCEICHSYPCNTRCPNWEGKQIGECAECGNEIYAEFSFFKDNEDNMFCSEECAKEYHEIKEVEWEEDEW